MMLRAPRRTGFVLLALSISLLAGLTARAQAPVPAKAAAVAPPSEGGVRWQSLTPAQHEALAPLEHEWPTIDPTRKQKWLVIAGRLNTLPPSERARISARMSEWARLSPAERGEVRLRYQEARQVPAPDRSARWEAYQKLPPNEKQQFAARAAWAVPPPPVASKQPSREPSQGKANVITNPALVQPPRPVAPTVVQASRGATTHLMTRPTAPPAHQQTGMPKIAATSEFVNRSTLLPQRGPQAAAVTPMNVSTRPYTPVLVHPVAPAGAAKANVPIPPR